jgi:class 3 adenylate cyclase/predicted ATPase
MAFEDIIDRAIDILRRRQRVAYRTLKVQLELDDDGLEALKDELLYAQRVARDEDGRVLVWCGETPSPSSAPSAERRTPDAERRHLTVLFCDLVESTRLAGQLDPEDLREVVRAYQATCADVVQRFDGHVAQYLGDGLLVYFGYPHAHEDDAQRAIRAGLEIVQAIQGLNAGLDTERRVRLAVRVGVHTGLVVIGDIGTRGREEQLAMGETPNVAARIQALAEPDTVIMSGATGRLVQGYFVCRDLGPHQLKGVSGAVALSQVLGESGRQSRLDIATAGGLTPLVGRESELTLLLDRWAQARDGLGQVVMLSGEAGIGKSRLVQAFKDHIAATPHLTWECRCSPYHQHSALYPIIDLFHHLLGWRPDDSHDDKREKLEHELHQDRIPLAEAVPVLATLLSLPLPEGRYPPLALSPQRQKQKIMETVLELLLARAERQPILVIVEDLHWVDHSTLELLGLLVGQRQGAKLLVLMTCRPDFNAPWGAPPDLTQIALHRLSGQHVEAMIARLTRGKSLPPEVTRQVVTRTDGVPLFVEELIKTVLESGWLEERADHYAPVGPQPPQVIPATLHDALMARLDRLNTAKTVAQLAATIGRSFTYDVLRAIAPLDEPTLQTSLRQLIDAELVHGRGAPPQVTYTFKHALIQEAAYQSLLKTTRQRYHRLIAEALEAGVGDVATMHPEILAHHLTEGDLGVRAMEYWRRAGQRAIERSAHVEAINHLTRGLATLEARTDDAERARDELSLLFLLGLPLVATRGQAHPDVERTYVRARDLSRRLDASPDLALQGLLSVYVVRAELDAARRVVDELFALSEEQRDTSLGILGPWARGQSLFFAGQLALARTSLDQAIDRHDAHPRPARGVPAGFPGDLGVFSRCFAAHSLWHLGYPDQSLRRMSEALDLAEQLAHPYTRALALAYRAMLFQFRGEAHMVRNAAEAAIVLCREQGFAYYLAWATIMHGWSLTVLDGGEEGIVRMHEGLGIMRATGAAVRRPYYLGLLADACGRTARVEPGLTFLAEALARAEETGEGWSTSELHRQRGELLLAEGDELEAECSFRRALATCSAQEAKSPELRATMSLARLWQRQGKDADARELLAPIHGWFREGFDTPDVQESAVLLDVLAATSRPHDHGGGLSDDRVPKEGRQ